jgi:hypothetical protein
MTRHNGDITSDNTLRAPVVKAAELLGLTEGAVRQRIKRGTLPVEKASDGSVYVLLDAELVRAGVNNTRTDTDNTRTNTDTTNDLRMTIERLDSEVSFLRSELITRNEELRRKDHIIAALTERIPELEPAREPAPEPRESPKTASESEYKGEEPPPDTERRSWLSRFFFGP